MKVLGRRTAPRRAIPEDGAVEEVLVVPRVELFAPPAAPFQGLQVGDGEGFLQGVGAQGYFVPRDRAEPDASLKQIIPYGLILHDGAAFLFWRSRKGGEARLHEKASLGVGGHVNPQDLPSEPAPGALRSAVERAFLRELCEEVELEEGFRTEVIGVLNDDSNPVGSVHFGIVYAVWAASGRVRVREEDLLRGEFVPLASLREYRPLLETWSAILLDQLPLLSGLSPRAR